MFFTCMFAFDNIVGEYSVQDVNVFYQNDVDTMEDSIEAGILDDIDMKYVLDTSYSTYTLDPGYAHRAYSTWLKRRTEYMVGMMCMRIKVKMQNLMILR